MSALGHSAGNLVPPDPEHSLLPSGNLRRRQLTSRVFVVATVSAAALAVAVLMILVYYTAKHGISQMSLSFLTKDLAPPVPGGAGGIGPALAGTMELVAISTLIALPVGLLTAVYLAEFANPRIAQPLRIAVELMAGLPTIIIGLFVAGLIVDHYGESAIAGGIALSIVQVPLITRASLEAISRVPHSLREAADALGVAHWRSITGVILPTAASGIVTATMLAIARAAGETAPVLLTSNSPNLTYQMDPRHAVMSIPLEIWNLFGTGYPSAIDKAWGAAFFLIIVILLINVGARVWLRRSERKRGL